MKILVVLENFHGHRRGRFKRPTYGTSIINRKNATYARFVPHLERVATRLRFTETSPVIVVGRHTKVPVDLDWVRAAVNSEPWDLIITFGTKARRALEALEVPHTALPHPISFQWRRAIIEELVDTLHTTQEKQ